MTARCVECNGTGETRGYYEKDGKRYYDPIEGAVWIGHDEICWCCGGSGIVELSGVN